MPDFDALKIYSCGKHHEKGDITGNKQFLPFSRFLPYMIISLVHMILNYMTGQRKLWEKEKKNAGFSIVFNSFLSKDCENLGLFSKGLKNVFSHSKDKLIFFSASHLLSVSAYKMSIE